MQTKAQQAGAEVRQLRACINDLIGVVALPAVWKGTAPSEIGRTLLDTLLSTLHLDFVYLRLEGPVGESPFEVVRVAHSHAVTVQLEEIGELLKGWREGHPQKLPQLMQKPFGDGELSIVPLPLGLGGEVGVLVAGSRRADFPVPTERLLLSVAANQATIGLQEAWLLSEQKRVADELDRRVAQKTQELAAANNELRDRERRIRRLVDANILGIFIWNLEGAIVEANEAFLHMLQYGREDVLSGRVRWTDLTPPEWREHDEGVLAELKATGMVPPYEKEYFRKDGTRVPVLVAGALFEEGGSEGVAFALDLSEQKRAEDQLQVLMSERTRLAAVRTEIAIALASKDTLRGILHRCTETMVRHLDAAFARIWTLNNAGVELELEASAGMYTRLDGGFSRIPVGKINIGLIAQQRKAHLTNDVQNDPRINDRNWAKAEKMQSFAGYPLVVEDRVVGVMGLFSRQVLTESTVETLAFIADGIAQGIERKHAEEALRESEEQTRLIVDTALDAVVTMDADGLVKRWTARAERMFGWTAKEAMNNRMSELIIPPQYREAHEFGLRKFLATGEGALLNRTVEGTALRRDGQEFPVELSVAPAKLGGGWIFNAFVRDVSERKRAEQALQEAQAELAHVTRLTTMGELAASIAHEINQPLAAIVANGEACLRWLKSEPANVDEARESARKIIRDGSRAGEVIKGIRGLARKSALQLAPLSVNELIEEVIALTHGEIQRKRVLLKTELTTDLPGVLGDRVQLEQVVLNLILNGMEAMAEVAPEQRSLVVGSGRSDPNGVVVYLRDCGAGISAEAMQSIFKPFFTTKPGGTGMGLSISRSIVEAHGGRLWAAPNDDRGMTFSFSIPGVAG